MRPVLFVDFDGTLFDTVPTLWRCYEAFLKGFGVSAERKDFEGFIGPSLLEVVIELKKKYGLDHDDHELLLHYESLVAKAYQENISLFPGAFECLDAIRNKGIRASIVTTAPQNLVKPLLKKKGILNFFETVFSPLANEATKPDPAIYLRALKEMNALPSQAIAIEDSKAGLISATSAGIKTFYFNEGRTWRDVRDFIICEFHLD